VLLNLIASETLMAKDYLDWERGGCLIENTTLEICENSISFLKVTGYKVGHNFSRT
jgi:hypothetical protein